MKDYITKRIAELELRLKECQKKKASAPCDLSFNAQVNENLILMYVFAITELETALEN